MTVTFDSFTTSHPEFIPAGEDLIEAKVAAAVLQVDAEVWGDKVDLGVELTAAHLLAMSPFGQNARLVPEDGVTIYERQLRRMQMQVGHRALVP